jgi:hypothetical protein
MEMRQTLSVFNKFQTAYVRQFPLDGYMDSQITDIVLCQDSSSVWLEVFRGNLCKIIRPLKYKFSDKNEDWRNIVSKRKRESRGEKMHAWQFNCDDTINKNVNRLIFGHTVPDFVEWGIVCPRDSHFLQMLRDQDRAEWSNGFLSREIFKSYPGIKYGRHLCFFDLETGILSADLYEESASELHELFRIYPAEGGISIEPIKGRK